MKEEIFRMERVTYKEQGVTLLENFSMAIYAGEIMGLVPVDHFGLSTLIRLFKQNLPLHYGYVYYREKLVNDWRSPAKNPYAAGVKHADLNHISVIRNQSCLAKDLTVADNIFVLRPGFKKRLLQAHLLNEQLLPFLEEAGIDIPANAYVEELAIFEQFIVELLKAVVAGNRLVILEDVSTFISDAQLRTLIRILNHYAKKGVAFLYIAAHYEEASQVCGRTAVMLNGQITKCFYESDKAPDFFYLQCIEDYDRHVREHMERRSAPEENQTVFTAKGFCSGHLRNLNFTVARGECLVLQDLDNCMIRELIPVLSGIKRPQQGQISIRGEACRCSRRLAVIQELPVKTMLFPNLSYLDNLCFTLDHRIWNVWINGRFKRSLRRELGAVLGDEVFDRNVEELTEIQKYDLIYMRVMLQKPEIVFCVQPFKSAEMSLRNHIMELLERFLNHKIPVVIMAVNLADSLALADRLLRVDRDGKQQEYHRNEFASLPVNTPWLYLYQKHAPHHPDAG